MIEMAYNEFAASYLRKELTLDDLGILSMSLDQVFLFLLILSLHLYHALLAYASHDLFLLGILSEILIVALFRSLTCLEQRSELGHIMQLTLLVLNLLLHLDGLISNGFFHNHVGEESRCFRLNSAWSFHLS